MQNSDATPKADAEIQTRGKNYELLLDSKATVVFGDENSLSFKPAARYSAFGEDGSGLTFRTPTSKNITPFLDKGVLGWDDPAGNIGTRFFQHADKGRWERGALEYQVLLYAVPPSPLIPFSAEPSDLILYPQGPLDAWELARGNSRPADLIGGFVAYHRTKGFAHFVKGDADIYRRGKAFELPVPTAVDALGSTAIGVWKQDGLGGIAGMAFDPDWILGAKYPVTIGPSIGYTSLGGSNDATGQFALANQFTAGASGDANPGIAYYGGLIAAGTAPVYVGVYDLGDGNISGNNRLAASSVITLDTSVAFRSAAITWMTIVNGAAYYLETYSQTVAVQTKYDNTTGANEYTATVAGAASPPDPHVSRTGTQANFTPSVYVDFTAGGGATPKLFRRNSLSGLGSGGPFFHNPLEN